MQPDKSQHKPEDSGSTQSQIAEPESVRAQEVATLPTTRISGNSANDFAGIAEATPELTHNVATTWLMASLYQESKKDVQRLEREKQALAEKYEELQRQHAALSVELKGVSTELLAERRSRNWRAATIFVTGILLPLGLQMVVDNTTRTNGVVLLVLCAICGAAGFLFNPSGEEKHK
jgi:hypothetical protein